MHTLRLVVCCAAVGTMGLSALAQDGAGKAERPPARQPRPDGPPPGAGQREPLSPEKAKAAWTLEATGVAKRIGASDDQAKGMVKAYAEARESQAKASDKTRQEIMEKARGGDEGGGGRGGFSTEGLKAMEEMNAKEREKLQKALAATLSAD